MGFGVILVLGGFDGFWLFLCLVVLRGFDIERFDVVKTNTALPNPRNHKLFY